MEMVEREIKEYGRRSRRPKQELLYMEACNQKEKKKQCKIILTMCTIFVSSFPFGCKFSYIYLHCNCTSLIIDVVLI